MGGVRLYVFNVGGVDGLTGTWLFYKITGIQNIQTSVWKETNNKRRIAETYIYNQQMMPLFIQKAWQRRLQRYLLHHV